MVGEELHVRGYRWLSLWSRAVLAFVTRYEVVVMGRRLDICYRIDYCGCM